MRGEEELKKGEGKGFAGLSSLVSNVDTPPPSAAKIAPAAAAPSTERPASEPAQSQPSQPHQTYQEPAQPPSSGSSGTKWVLGIAAVIGVLWLIGQSDKSPTSPAPAYSPPAQTATPSYSAPPAELQAPSRPQESMPPVGQDLVFSTAQIGYCLAEEIRLGGAKSALNNYIDSDVERFNAMVAAYNSRCGSFRYRSGALESARRDMEPYRSQLQSEGQSLFGNRSAASPPATMQYSPALDTTLRTIPYTSPPSFTNVGTARNGTRMLASKHTRNDAGTGIFFNLKRELQKPEIDATTNKEYTFTLGHVELDCQNRNYLYSKETRFDANNQTVAYVENVQVPAPFSSFISLESVFNSWCDEAGIFPALHPLNGQVIITSKKANVRDAPRLTGSQILIEVPQGMRLDVFGIIGEFYVVKIDQVKGYLSRRTASPTP